MKSIQPSPIPPLRGDVNQWSNDLTRYIEKHLQDHFYDIQNIIAPTEDTDDSISFWEKTGTTLTTKPSGMAVNLGSAAFSAGAGSFSSLLTTSLTATTGAITTLTVGTATGTFNANNTIISNVLTPVSDHDGVNKEYVDTAIADIDIDFDKKANIELDNLSNVQINSSLLFDTDNTYDIGDITHRIRNFYIGGRIGGNLLPYSTNTYDVGTSSWPWREFWGNDAVLSKYYLVGGVTRLGPDEVFHYGCNETTGTTVTDLSLHANNATSATDTSNLTDSDHATGTAAFHLDRQETHYIDTDPTNTTLIGRYNYYDSFSIAFWVKLDVAIQDNACVLSKRRSSSSLQGASVFGYYIDYDTASTSLLFTTENRITTDGTYLSVTRTEISSGVLSNATWYHIVVTYSNGAMNMYVNGSWVSSGTFTATPARSPAQNLTIGVNRSDGYNWNGDPAPDTLFHGIVDDIRLFNGAIDQGIIDSIYNSNAGTEDTLIYANPPHSAIGTTGLLSSLYGCADYADLLIEGVLEVQDNFYVHDNSMVRGNSQSHTFTSVVPTGTQPYACESTTLNTNLNAEHWNDKHLGTVVDNCLVRYEATGTQLQTGTVTEVAGALGSITTIGMSGRLTNTLASGGLSPFVITSTTVNANLNADLLDGYHVGTSGSTVPLLNTANTWSATQTFGTTTNLSFRDAAVYIYSANDGYLDLVADTGIRLNRDTSTAYQFTSSLAIGTKPFAITSTTMCDNLNADLWDDKQFSDYLDQAVKTTSDVTHNKLKLTGNGLLWSDGTTGTNPISGAGYFMAWIPDMGAFRAGRTSVTDQWGVGSVGPYSAALGYRVRAFGEAAMSFGEDCAAFGDYSVACVDNATTMGYATFAGGQWAIATGDNSFAMGCHATTGYARSSFTCDAGGVTITIAGDVTAQFTNGDNVRIVRHTPANNLPVARHVASVPVFAAGNTTFDIDALIDASTTGGAIADVDKGTSCVSIGYAQTTGVGAITIGMGGAVNSTSDSIGFGLSTELDLLLTAGSANFQDCTVVTTGTVSGASLIATTTDILYAGADKFFHTTGTANIFIGVLAGDNVTTGQDNFGFGYASLFSCTDGTYNTCMGAYTMTGSSSGSYNTLMGGGGTGYAMTSANSNVGIGFVVLNQLTEGDNNICIGPYAGNALTTGSGSVFLGFNAGKYETASDKLFIDNQDRTDEATSRTSSLVYGIFDAAPANQLFRVNGTLDTTGEAKGQRVTLACDKISGSVDSYFRAGFGVTFTSTYGWKMPRAGSIVGLGIMMNSSAVTVDGNVVFYVKVNDGNVFDVTVTSTGAGVDSNSGTQARGTDVFAAGDFITIYADYTTFQGTMTAIATLELQLDT